MSARKSIAFTRAKATFPAASVRSASRDRDQPPSALGNSLECAPAQLRDWFFVSDNVPVDVHRTARTQRFARRYPEEVPVRYRIIRYHSRASISTAAGRLLQRRDKGKVHPSEECAPIEPKTPVRIQRA